MIGWLRGRLRSEEADGTIVVDVHGVGYELKTPVGGVGRARAVAASDFGRLGKVPGIGKKTAERLVLELKDKLGEAEVGGRAEGSDAPAPGARGRLLSALTNMGYRPGEAEKAVATLGRRVDSAPLAELLKAALAELR